MSRARSYLARWLSAWLPVVALEALVLFASSRPHLRPPSLLPHLDKAAHFVEYAALGGLLYRALRVSGGRRVEATWYTLILGAAFAGADEWLQSHVPGRFASWSDGIADLAGIATAVAVARFLERRAQLSDLRTGTDAARSSGRLAPDALLRRPPRSRP